MRGLLATSATDNEGWVERPSYATAALASGVPVEVVSQRFGHADAGVTLKVYAHVLPGDEEDAALRADSLLAP